MHSLTVAAFCGAILAGWNCTGARTLRGPLATDATQLEQLSMHWACDTSWIALTTLAAPPYVKCLGRVGDTTVGAVTDTSGLVISTVRELTWDSITASRAAKRMIASVESRFGDGKPWCDAPGVPYRRYWQQKNIYMVLVVDSTRRFGNITATVGRPYCVPTAN